MRFSLWASLSNPWADVLDGTRHAEATGWDGVYVADHFMADVPGPFPADTPNLEATAAVSALAAATERVRLATLLLSLAVTSASANNDHAMRMLDNWIPGWLITAS